MVPDLDLQLGVSIKALRDVIIPAIDPANGVALEQAHLTLATLGMARQNFPYIQRLARTELRHAIAMGDAVAGSVQASTPLVDLRVAARSALADPEAGAGTLDACRHAILSEIETQIAQAETGEFAPIAKAYLGAVEPQLELQRKWSAGAGFDPDAVALPALDEMLD